MKKLANVFLFAGLLLTLLFVSGQAFADHEGKWAMREHDKGEEYQCPVVEKFMSKARVFLKQKKELSLSEDQIQSIKQLKVGVKKAYIQQKAAHEIFSLDIEQALSEPKPDVNAVGALIDQHAVSMAKMSKDTVTSYVNLKAILSEEQLAKVKELY